MPSEQSSWGRYGSPAGVAALESGDEAAKAPLDIMALVENCGHSIGPEIFARLLEIQKEMREHHDSYQLDLDTGRISADQFLSLFHQCLQTALRHCHAALGAEKFYAIFGEAGEDPSALIDREIFMTTSK